MGKDIRLSVLDRVQIASPCEERWENMTGDDRVRHCARCDLNVYNIAAMDRNEAEAVLSKATEGRVCARIYRRRDGTVLTRDCPVGIAAARKRVLKAVSRVAAAIGLASFAAIAAKAAEKQDWAGAGFAVTISNCKPVRWLEDRLFPQQQRGWLGGVVALPPESPVKSPTGEFEYGPHHWE